MKFPNFFDSKNSTNLFGLKENFDFFNFLYQKKKLPNVLLLSEKRFRQINACKSFPFFNL